MPNGNFARIIGVSRSVPLGLIGAGAFLLSFPAMVRGQQQPIDPARELRMKIAAPFTLVAVGDIIAMRPIAELKDPGVQGMLQIIRGADVAFGNMEGNIADYQHPESPLVGATGPRAIAADLKAMGFEIVNRANNHADENGIAGMFATDKYLEEVGIVHAGSGKDLAEARATQFYESPKGRVGLVGMNSAGSPASTSAAPATYKLGNTGGSPGVNPLRVTMYQNVTQDELDGLRKIRDAAYAYRSEVTHPVPPIPANEPKDRLQMSRVGESYKVGTPPGGLSYTMNSEDLRQNLRSIRNGKEISDFMIASIHAHEDPSAIQMEWFSEFPPDFLVELAHKAIDSGADAFLGHGSHILRGIEIYKGKPVFYGLGSFEFQLIQQLVPVDRYTAAGQDPFATDATGAELQWKYWDSAERPRLTQDILESVVAECKFDNGQLVEIVLHPIEEGFGRDLAEEGIPRLASPEVSQRILQKLQKLSKPLGTTITIEGNVGIIRVP